MATASLAQLSPVQLNRLSQEMVVREWVIDQLEGWLGENHDAPPIFLISGAPGAGKTAFMAQLMMLLGDEPIATGIADHAQLARRPALSGTTLLLSHFCDPTNERTLDPLDFITSLSEALARTVPGFAESLLSAVSGTTINIESVVRVEGDVHGGEIAGVKIAPLRDMPTRQAFSGLVRRPLESVAAEVTQQLLVLVDDVSSAYRFDSSNNLGALLGAVADNPAELSPCLRFVVTSRPDRWVLQSLPAVAVDLVSDLPADNDDISSYVAKRLAASPASHRSRWIDQVTSKAAGNFLYARHVLDQLLADPSLFQSETDLSLPAGLPELYAQWARHTLTSDRSWWREGLEPVLTMLAAACGEGLTLDQLSGITKLPTSKVRHAVEDCEQFLVGRPGGPVRIYHESFREYLVRDHVELEEGDEAILAFFRQTEGDDWLSASAYTRSYLPTHAAALGRLPELLEDPGFLIAADPAGIRPHLAWVEEDSRPASAYARAYGGFVIDDVAERASHVQLAALELGFSDLAEAVGSLRVDRRWTPLWTSLLRQRVSVTLGRLPGGVADFLTTQADDVQASVAALSVDGDIVVWEITTQSEVARFKISGPQPFERLAWCEGPDDDMFAVLSAGVIMLVGASTGTTVRRLGDRGSVLVTAVATIRIDDRHVLVAGYSDGVIAAYELDGSLVCEPVPAHGALVTDLTSTGVEVLSGGADGLVRAWDVGPERLDDLGQPFAVDGPWVNSCAALNDVHAWACAGLSDGSIRWGNTSNGFDPVWAFDSHVTASWRRGYDTKSETGSWTRSVTTNGGQADFASVLRDVEESARRDAEYARRQAGEDPAVDGGEPDSAANAPPVIRLAGGVNGVDLFRVGDRVLLATAGEDGAARVLDVGAEPPIEETLVPIGAPLVGVKFANGEGRTAMVTAEREGGGTVRAWQLSNGPGLLPPEVGELRALAVHLNAATAADGRSIAAAALSDRTVLVIDAATGEELAGQTMGPDCSLRGVLICPWAGDLLLAAYGARADESADGEDSSLGMIYLWPQWRDPAVPAVQVELPGLTDVLGLVCWNDELLVTGQQRTDETPVWRVRQTDAGWTAVPCPVSTSEDNDLSDLARCTAVDVVADANGAHLVVRDDFGDLWDVSLTDWEARPGDLMLHGGVFEPLAYQGQLCFLGGETVVELTLPDGERLLAFADETNDGKLTAIAALPDLTLVVAGRDDGRLSVWRTPGETQQVIQLGSDARQIVVCKPDIVLVRTELGLYTLRLDSAVGMGA